MKKFLFNLIAAVLIGSVCYGIFLWVFGWTQKDALALGLSITFSSLIMEYLKPLITRKKIEKTLPSRT
jgi:predicted PurR-regulated permease PerM